MRASVLICIASAVSVDAVRTSHRAALRRECDGKGAAQKKAGRKPAFLSSEGPADGIDLAGELTGYIFADGYSRVACEVDVAPADVRISFKEHACGKIGGTCRLTELGMQPRLCFDFCRQYPNVHFFGIHAGRDCYCSTYFDAHSTGGQGECNAVCEGDAEQMCGGMDKSSLFEMHMCDDSSSEADLALDMSAKASLAAQSAAAGANATAIGLRAMADAWQLGVCSVAPEGPRVCRLNADWLAKAGGASDAASDATHAASVLATTSQSLTTFKAGADAAGDKVNASLASNVELTTAAVHDAASSTIGKAAAVNFTVQGIAGPLLGKSLAGFTEAFEHIGASDGWSTLCGLEQMPGQSFAGVAPDAPSSCGDRCLGKSTGIGGCVGFNYQYKDGIAACQLLTETGLVQPMLAKAVPVFEVSNSKRDAMGFQSIGCYTHHAFTAGHPKGPLKAEVIREVIVDR